jgi:hypothetical protein
MKRGPTPHHYPPESIAMHARPLLFFATVLSFALSFATPALPQSCCGPITPAGQHLADTLDGMHVESLWPDGMHVNWETGEPDRPAGFHGSATHSHCSAFAASTAKRLGVYLLRPPDHGQVLLSNAQAEWLASPAASQRGWRPVADMGRAQHLANQGTLVIALFQSPDPHRPGHDAIVRPSNKSAALLEENGPEEIQAGEENFTRTTVRHGFSHHPGAWPSGVRYYAHPLP